MIAMQPTKATLPTFNPNADTLQDRLENQLHKLVCSRAISIQQAAETETNPCWAGVSSSLSTYLPATDDIGCSQGKAFVLQ